jgi:hypothetical protein
VSEGQPEHNVPHKFSGNFSTGRVTERTNIPYMRVAEFVNDAEVRSRDGS